MAMTAAPQVVDGTSMARLTSLRILACKEQNSNNFDIRQSSSTAGSGHLLKKPFARYVTIEDTGYERSMSGLTMCTR